MGGKCIQGRRRRRAAGLFIAAAVGVSGWTASRALGQTNLWSGSTIDDNWSDAANWGGSLFPADRHWNSIHSPRLSVPMTMSTGVLSSMG